MKDLELWINEQLLQLGYSPFSINRSLKKVILTKLLFQIEDLFLSKANYLDLRFARKTSLEHMSNEDDISLNDETDTKCMNFPICSDTGSCADGQAPCYDGPSNSCTVATPCTITTDSGSTRCIDESICVDTGCPNNYQCHDMGTPEQKCLDNSCVNKPSTSNCVDWYNCNDYSCQNKNFCQDFYPCTDNNGECSNQRCVNYSVTCIDSGCMNEKCMRLGRSSEYSNGEGVTCVDTHCDP